MVRPLKNHLKPECVQFKSELKGIKLSGIDIRKVELGGIIEILNFNTLAGLNQLSEFQSLIRVSNFKRVIAGPISLSLMSASKIFQAYSAKLFSF